MFKRPDVAVMLTVCLALAGAGVKVKAAVIDGAAAPAKAAPPGSGAQQQTPRYHLRCWQDGRLLFEQAVATLPADAGRSTRLHAKDGSQEPVIVYETRNATCMARSLRAATAR
jgi:hypothetical protein